MFVPRPIGFVSSPYNDTKQIPKGLHTKHEAEGILRILPEFETGLTDIEGFSHLFVLWEFDRSQSFDLIGKPPFEDRPHGVFATRSPRRPNPIGLSVVSLLCREDCKLHVRGSTCSTERPYSISSPACRVFRQKHYAAVGWQKQNYGAAVSACTG
jgi:tRNA-Thr(GGU) m(6)t(6)A37 methyltransferase TsaA